MTRSVFTPDHLKPPCALAREPFEACRVAEHYPVIGHIGSYHSTCAYQSKGADGDIRQDNSTCTH